MAGMVGVMRARAWRALLLVAAVLVQLYVVQAPVLAMTQPPDSFVADGATPYHDGLVSGDSLTPPLVQRWALDFATNGNGNVSSALVVGNRAFLSVNSGSGSHVYALDVNTGGLLWTGPAGDTGSLTYDNGKVFGLFNNYNSPYGGFAYALDATTGHELWTALLPGQFDYGPPTAANGVLYAVGDGMVAVNESTGALIWRSAWFDGTGDSATVTDNGLFLAGPCSDFFGVNAADGSTKWTHTGGCSGGGTGSLSYHNGRLYGSGHVIDAANGQFIGTYPNSAQLAFDGGTAFWVSGGNLQAYDLATQQILWTYAGDGGLGGVEPLVVNGQLYVASVTGKVFAVPETGGGASWSTQVATAWQARPWMVAGSSTLFVITGGAVHAFGAPGAVPTVASVTPASGPAAGGTVVSIHGNHLSGTTGVTFGGVAGTSVTIESDALVTAHSPPGSAGTVAVVAQAAVGPSTYNPTANFTYFADAPEVSGDDAVTFRMDPRHLATVVGDSFTLPTGKKWSVDLGGTVSYPLIVGNRVYVLVAGASNVNNLVALDAATGLPAWGPVPAGRAFGLTYDAGKVFTLDGNDLVQAFDAVTGLFKWSNKLSESFADAMPTALDGVLYIGGTGSGGTVTALNESNGVVLWTRNVANGDNSAPTVTHDSVFVSYACDFAFGFATDGSPQWSHYAGCEGGGGATASLYQGRLYLRDGYQGNAVVDQKTGYDVAHDPAGGLQTFWGNNTYFLASGNSTTVLQAVELGSNLPLWSFSGDGGLNSAPIQVNGLIYVASSSGMAYALDAGTGAVAWSENVGAPILASGDGGYLGGGPPVPGLALARGLLAIPAGNRLVAYQSNPGPRVSVDPVSGLDFGSRPIGFADGSQQLTVTNSGNDTLTFSSPPAISGPAASQFAITATTCASSLPPSGQCTVTVDFVPSTRGPAQATLDLSDNAPDAPQHVPLHGVGTAPEKLLAAPVQYTLSSNDGSSWTPIDAPNLSFTVKPLSTGTVYLVGNADLWTWSSGLNQDIGLQVTPAGGSPQVVAWKESGGRAGTFSPNAAMVQAAYPVTAGVRYTVTLVWKTNRPIATGEKISAGAGPPGAFSPTTLAGWLLPDQSVGLLGQASSSNQYTLAGSAGDDGSTWRPVDNAALTMNIAPSVDGIVRVVANADLWTASAGYNQDIGLEVRVGTAAPRVVAWKESGGFAGTYSPNAAAIDWPLSVTGGVAYRVRLVWRANRPMPAGASIAIAAGGIGAFSPTTMVAIAVPDTAAPMLNPSTSTQQYTLAATAYDDGTAWRPVDSSTLRLTVTPTQDCRVGLAANADLWTWNAGYNQDIGIQVQPQGGAAQVVSWKESGGFAGTFSPNAAFVQGSANLLANTTYTVTLVWRVNRPMPSGHRVSMGAGSPGQISTSQLTSILHC